MQPFNHTAFIIDTVITNVMSLWAAINWEESITFNCLLPSSSRQCSLLLLSMPDVCVLRAGNM